MDEHVDLVPIPFPLKPGDVILSSRAGLLPSLLRRAGDMPVTHAAIAITDRHGIEARDNHWELSDSTGGVFLRPVDELTGAKGLQLVVIRRPPFINESALQTWAIDRILGAHTFSSSGLAMMGPLRALIRLADLDGPGNRPLRASAARWAMQRTAVLAEAVADGITRLICAELVYRGLLTAGCPLDLTNALFEDALAALPEAQPDVRSSWDSNPVEVIEALAIVARPFREPSITGSADAASLIAEGLGNFTDQWRRRHSEAPNGDQADLVTPGDLLTARPLQTIAAFQRTRNGSWSAALSQVE
jgi:hypothetical protein